MIIYNANPVKLVISNVDFSNCITEINLSNSGVDFSGLVKTTGSITFDTTLFSLAQLNNRKFFDPRINKSFWKRGAKVTIEVANNLGVYRKFIRGTLRLLGMPVWSYDDDTVSIPVGCELVHHDISEPDFQFNSVKLGQDVARVDAVNIYLQAKGISSSITGLQFPLKWNINSTGGSGIQTCGNLAIETGYALFTTGEGLVSSFYILGSNKTLDVNVADDALEYDVVKAQNYDFDQLVLTAEKIEVKQWTPEPPITKDIFDLNGVKIGSTITRIPDQLSMETEVYTTRGLAFPKLYPNGDNTLFNSEQIKIQNQYQNGTGKKLDFIKEDRKKSKGLISPKKHSGDVTLIDCYSKKVDYVYNMDSVVIEERTTIKECRGIVFPDDPSLETGNAGDPFELITSYVLVRSFDKKMDKWFVQYNGYDVRQKQSLTESRKPEEPPQTQRKPNEFYTETSLLKSTTYIANTQERRIKRLQVNAVTGTEHLDRIAKTYFRILSSNNIVNRITLPYPFKDLDNNYLPYFNVNVTENYIDGTSQLFNYYSDNHSFLLSRDGHTVSFDLLFAGTTP